jgi:hypothetical protein
MKPEGSLPCSQDSPILNQMNQDLTLASCVFKRCFNIIFISVSRSSNLSHSFRFTNQNFICILFFPPVYYMPVHIILLILS